MQNLAETSRKPRENLAETSRKPRGNIAEPRGTSRKPRGNLSETSRKPRGNLSETSRKPRGNLAETSRKPLGNLSETSRKPFGNIFLSRLARSSLASEQLQKHGSLAVEQAAQQVFTANVAQNCPILTDFAGLVVGMSSLPACCPSTLPLIFQLGRHAGGLTKRSAGNFATNFPIGKTCRGPNQEVCRQFCH